MSKATADNASASFKCSKCGAIFALSEEGSTCPVCGYNCSHDACRRVDASDEGY